MHAWFLAARGRGGARDEPALGLCCFPAGEELSLPMLASALLWVGSSFRLESQQQMQPIAQLWHPGFCSNTHLLFLVKVPLVSTHGIGSGAMGRAVAAWVVGKGISCPKIREGGVPAPDAGPRGDLF